MTRLTSNGQVEFRFYRPDARDVRIAGDFNQWDRAALTMHPDGNGWWTAVAEIKSGDHRFRYYADGQWFTDFAANGVEQTKLGWNSVLTVPRVKAAGTNGMGLTGSRKTDIQTERNAEQYNKVKMVA